MSQLELIAELVPKNSADFALLDDAYIRGGFHVVANLTDRNSIPMGRRKVGMRVAVATTDAVYKLSSDLITWIADTTSTTALQAAYNAGATINIADLNPLVLQEPNTLSPVFVIKNPSGNAVVNVVGDAVELKELKAEAYRGHILTSVGQNTTVQLDSTDGSRFRAIQYAYTISNSDSSGYSTGQLYIVHDTSTASLCDFSGNTVGAANNLAFSASLVGGQVILSASAGMGGFSRIVHLFKIALS